MNRKRCNVVLIQLMILFCLSIEAYAGINIDTCISSSDVEVTQLVVDDIVYDVITVNGYQDCPANAVPGDPQIPSRALNYLLPTDQQISEIEIVAMEWDTIPGSFYVYPIQSGSMEDTTFSPPNPDIYLSGSHWPESPVEVLAQSGMMGVGVATISTTPVRYIPADSMLLALTELTLSIQYGTAQFEVVVPVSETDWSYTNRIQGILASVQNPEDYTWDALTTARRDLDNQTGPLAITETPSPNGDGVDFVIITTEALEDAWQELADIRTRQGIITVVRTVEWIESEYNGCDTQEKMKSFIADAYEFWGTGVVLLGGDHELVPSRICKANDDGSKVNYPCDSYYADVDEDQSWQDPDHGYWVQPVNYIQVEVSVGRVPVDNEEMVELFINKLLVYENPSSLPAGFGRSALLIGDSSGSAGDGAGAWRCEALNQELISAGIAPGISGPGQYLNEITELYWPATGSTWNGDELTRISAINAINEGQNIIFHIAHSGTHQLGTQSAVSLRQYLTEGDVQDLENTGMPGILISCGCWPGHFEGTECILERGLFSSDEAGLIAGMGFARSGGWSDPTFFFNELANALYEYKPYQIGGSSFIRVGPYMHLGDCYRHMMNSISRPNEQFMNLLGDPSMFVWRGNPLRPTVIAPSQVTAGTFNVTIQVKSLGIGLPRAKVCLYKENELFAIGTTGPDGYVTFNGIHAATPGEITVTVIKRKAGIDIANYLPATATIEVEQSTDAVLSLSALDVDDDDASGSFGNDDGEVNPGETIMFDLVVDNTGQNPATNASATLSVVSGSDQIANQIDMTQSLGTVSTGPTTYTNAFALQIADDVEPGSDPVILQVAFSYDQGSITYPADFRVLVGETDLPVRTMTITQGDPLIINIDNMFLTNSGLGNLEDVEVAFTNAVGVTFTGDLSESFGDLANGSGEEVEDGIRAILRNPSGCWSNPITEEAEFDLEISHRWGSETITVNAFDVLQQGTVEPPDNSSMSILSLTDDMISYEWGNPAVTSNGWYLWKMASGAIYWTRVNTFPLDGALRHGLIDDLVSGTEYSVGVSVIGAEGQESSIASISTSTTCGEVDGWPVYLDGSTGTGPAICDIDGDGDNEVIAATSAGSVYIIEGNGSATRIYDSPYLFSGVAIGDVYAGGRDEIVVCGWDYDMGQTGKKAVVVVLKWTDMVGWTGTELDAASGGGQRIHENLSVPVLFNADNTGDLEIALRTFSGTYGAQCGWLYVWEYTNSQWGQMSGFPKTFAGAEWDFAPPVYIGDTDSDNYPELVVSKGTEALYWIEPATGQDATWNVGSEFPASYSGTRMNWNLGQSLITAVREGSTTKLIVVGRHSTATSYSSSGYYSTACLNASNGGSGFWRTGVNESWDPWGVFGGPAIGDIDGDNDLDIANVWIPKTSPVTGIAEYLTLADGAITSQTGIPYYRNGEDYAMSPVVIAGEEGDGLAVFGSLSTVSHGSIFESGSPEVIPGSSYWSMDRMMSCPVVGNLDQDSDLEVIFGDDSGVLYALDMNLSPSSADWPMLQHDLQRTGYFNFTGRGGLDTSLDFQIVDVSLETASVLSQGNRAVTVDVAITGSGHTDCSAERAPVPEPNMNAPVTVVSGSTSARIQHSNSSSVHVSSEDYVSVALFSGSRLISMKRIPLVDGHSSVVLSLSEDDLNGELTVAVDPFGEYQEADESNNTHTMGSAGTIPIEEISIESTSDCIRISIPAEALSHEVAEAMLFSIDGRLVSSCRAEISSGEGCSLNLTNSDGSLPFGCYVILLNDGEDLILRRKVLVID